MGLFTSLFGAKTPVKAPVTPLPKLTTPSGPELAVKSNASPAARALATPGQSSSEYIHTLEQNNMSTDTVNGLAHGMPERESVGWACQSSETVADKLEPSDKTALQSAQQWVKNPSPENQAAAGAAAAKTNFQGPGAWAAQGAAWSQNPAQTAASQGAAAAVPKTPGLTGNAVAGSVMLAAAMSANAHKPTTPNIPATPVEAADLPKLTAPQIQQPALSLAEQNEMAKAHQPYIKLGKSIASGQQPVA